MWNIIIIVALLVILVAGVINIRSLIRKWKHNPKNWVDLLIGILIWGFAFGLLFIQLLKHLDIIR
jgi:cell shape-determining protein MreD